LTWSAAKKGPSETKYFELQPLPFQKDPNFVEKKNFWRSENVH
jgi:hypothetical protein